MSVMRIYVDTHSDRGIIDSGKVMLLVGTNLSPEPMITCCKWISVKKKLKGNSDQNRKLSFEQNGHQAVIFLDLHNYSMEMSQHTRSGIYFREK